MRNVIIEYRCPYCLETYKNESKAKSCMERCKRIDDREYEIYKNKIKELIDEGINFSSKDSTILLLVKNNRIADARKLCELHIKEFNVSNEIMPVDIEFILDRMIEEASIH